MIVALLEYKKEELTSAAKRTAARQQTTGYMMNCAKKRRLTEMRGYLIMGSSTEIYSLAPHQDGKIRALVLAEVSTSSLFHPGNGSMQIGSLYMLAERSCVRATSESCGTHTTGRGISKVVLASGYSVQG